MGRARDRGYNPRNRTGCGFKRHGHKLQGWGVRNVASGAGGVGTMGIGMPEGRTTR